MDELLKDFLTESVEQLDAIGAQLVRFEQDPSDTRIVANIFRLVHAIKGTCGFLNLPRLERVAHAAETLIDRLREGAPPNGDVVTLVLATVDRIKMILVELAEGRCEPLGDDDRLIAELETAAAFNGATLMALAPVIPGEYAGSFGPGPTPPERRIDTVRISVKSLDRLTSLVSELVLTRNQLIDVARAVEADAIRAPLRRLSRVAADLQSGVLAARMLPVERLFANLHRLARDLCADLGKKAELILQGGGTELDRQLIETVRDSLTQMIRNAIDHGIEPPDERRRLGKPETGVIRISAGHKAGLVSIDVDDDGRGLDLASVRERAFALGFGSREHLSTISEDELCRFVFAPGFTTANRVSPISGRGVGLDLVRVNIEEKGGSVSMLSRSGQGATVSLRIPLALAIIPAFVLRSGGECFALPQHSVEEIVELEPGDEDLLASVQGAMVLNAAEGVAPAGYLHTLLRMAPAADSASGRRLALKMRTGVHGFAILIDEILDVRQIVLKPLPTPLRHLPMFSAAAILGDGAIILVLDPSGLAGALGLPKSCASWTAGTSEPKSSPDPTHVVIFRAGGPALRALPVSAVARILALAPGQIEFEDAARVVRVDGRPLPVVRMDLDRSVGARKPNETALILQKGDDRLALIIDEVVDVVEEELKVDFLGAGRGALGVASLRGEATEILDPCYFFDQCRDGPLRAATGSDRDRILLVEPAAFFRDLIAAALARSGYAVCAVTGPDEALDALGGGRSFAAVLADIDLAGARQGEFARQIHAAVADESPVTIALAPHGGPSIQASARKAGLSCAVGKFDRSAMISALRVALAPRAKEIAA